MIICTDCHKKIKVARSRTRTRDHDDEVTDG